MQITPDFALDEALIRERFVRSAGPGGQNVNKVASAVQLRIAIADCALEAAASERLAQLAHTRLNRRGEIVITANRHRSQSRNREEARERLARLIRRALIPVVARKPKRPPSAAAKRRRIADKRRRGEVKRTRRSPAQD